MTIERDKCDIFTLNEWKQIQDSIEAEDPVQLIEVNGQNVSRALLSQWPELYRTWQTYERAESEFFYIKGNSMNILKN